MHTSQTRREFVLRAGGSALAMSSLGTLISACGGGDDEGGASGTITLWSDVSEAGAKRYFERKVVAPFEEEHPGLNVEVTYQNPEELERQIRLALQAQEAPDLIPTNGPAFVPELADAGFLADLDSYAEEHGWDEALLPWAVDLGRVNDELVAIPTQLETLGVYINKTVFDEHGWTPPENREQLEDLVKEIEQAGLIPFAGGTADLRQQIEWYTSVFFSNTAGPQVFYEVLTGEQPWTVEPMLEAVELMRDYFDRGWFGGGLDRFFATGTDAFHAELASGKAAMSMEGTWFFEQVETFFGKKAGNDADWDFVAFPSLGEGVPYPIYPLGTGATLSVNAETEDIDGPASFIGYLIEDPKRTASWLAEQGAAFSYPVRFGPDDFPESMDPRQRDAYVSMVEATERGNLGYTNWTFSPPKTAVYIYEEVEKVLTGNMSPEDFLKGADETFQEDLDDGFTPRVPNPAAV